MSSRRRPKSLQTHVQALHFMASGRVRCGLKSLDVGAPDVATCLRCLMTVGREDSEWGAMARKRLVELSEAKPAAEQGAGAGVAHE